MLGLLKNDQIEIESTKTVHMLRIFNAIDLTYCMER